MPLFRREPGPAPAPAGSPVEDTPAAMLESVRQQENFINANAGGLPVGTVVAALNVTDTLRAVIATAAQHPLDMHGIIAIHGIVEDYLPTTLHAYLSLDPSATDVVRPSGRTPKQSLLEQVEALWLAANDLLTATRARDADALLIQGSFLSTKFGRTDLDL